MLDVHLLAVQCSSVNRSTFNSTRLEICEQRDRKGLYAKARAHKIKGVTGIDDPYITPSNPNITIDTSELTPDEAAREILLYLEEQGYVR